jgi:hypothetical protein
MDRGRQEKKLIKDRQHDDEQRIKGILNMHTT